MLPPMLRKDGPHVGGTRGYVTALTILVGEMNVLIIKKQFYSKGDYKQTRI